MKTKSVSTYAMRCRCGQPLAMADMRWFQPPRDILPGEGPIRQVCCETCAAGRVEAEPVVKHDLESCAVWLTETDDCTCGAG